MWINQIKYGSDFLILMKKQLFLRVVIYWSSYQTWNTSHLNKMSSGLEWEPVNQPILKNHGFEATSHSVDGSKAIMGDVLIEVRAILELHEG